MVSDTEYANMVSSLADIVRRCDDDTIGEGCAWYDGYAQAKCREAVRVPGAKLTDAQAYGLVCARNINSSWQGALTAAAKDASAIAAGFKLGGLRAAQKAATGIAAGERPWDMLGHMPKIGRFYRNIALRDFDCVTVDRWAARAAGAEHLTGRTGGYELIERAYQDAAADVGLPPAMVQAIVWIAVRGSGE